MKQQGIQLQLEDTTLQNQNYRQVVYTTPRLQLVLMSILPGDEIGLESHEEIDQFIRCESGQGEVIMGDKQIPIQDGDAVIIPAGVEHNVLSTGAVPLKLYSIYATPEHRDGTIHKEKSDDSEEHFDGNISA